MRLYRPFFFAKWLFPEALFRIRTSERVLCLTFDDGPNPDSTPLILDILDKHGIKAVFFCRGDAAEEFPELMKMIVSKGHLTGNHGFSHQDGWRIKVKYYLDDVKRASELTSSLIFRPPYGRLTMKQDKTLAKSYRIVFWDLMPYDFDPGFGSIRSLNILKRKIRPGTVIVLHDTPASSVLSFLDDFIDHASGKGYRFVLPDF